MLHRHWNRRTSLHQNHDLLAVGFARPRVGPGRYIFAPLRLCADWARRLSQFARPEPTCTMTSLVSHQPSQPLAHKLVRVGIAIAQMTSAFASAFASAPSAATVGIVQPLLGVGHYARHVKSGLPSTLRPKLPCRRGWRMSAMHLLTYIVRSVAVALMFVVYSGMWLFGLRLASFRPFRLSGCAGRVFCQLDQRCDSGAPFHLACADIGKIAAHSVSCTQLLRQVFVKAHKSLKTRIENGSLVDPYVKVMCACWSPAVEGEVALEETLGGFGGRQLVTGKQKGVVGVGFGRDRRRQSSSQCNAALVGLSIKHTVALRALLMTCGALDQQLNWNIRQALAPCALTTTNDQHIFERAVFDSFHNQKIDVARLVRRAIPIRAEQDTFLRVKFLSKHAQIGFKLITSPMHGSGRSAQGLQVQLNPICRHAQYCAAAL